MMPVPLQAGQLDRQVTIQRRAETRETALGSVQVTWPVLATVWAQVVESSTASDEAMRAGVQTFARPSKVRIRWRSDIDTTMRINHGGQLLQILGIAELGRRQGLELACKEWAHE